MKARLAVLAAAALATLPLASPAAAETGTATPIRHFIFLMQGGRTFDNYFAT